jgi:hypothetical protein
LSCFALSGSFTYELPVRLESNLMLAEEENGELIKKIEDFLREED